MNKSGIVIAILIILITAMFALIFDFKTQIYQKPLKIEEEHEFSIQKGDNLADILSNMHHESILEPYHSIIPLHWYVELYAYLVEASTRQIQAGVYLLNPNMKFYQFLDKTFSGQVAQRKLTIIEGYTMQQILDAIAATSDLNIDTTDYNVISQRLGISQSSPEGWIFPDTYYYTVGSDAMDLFAQGHRKMQTVLAEAWPTRDPRVPLASPYETLILASIVEKETSQIAERPLVAGVFIARLLKRMRLQADPTVIYGLGSRFDGNLRSRHLKEDQPYNSYIHKGLPPTPIAMPSLSSIMAVMNPVFDDYLYFVAKGDGSHYFSETYEQHLKAVRKYQLKK